MKRLGLALGTLLWAGIAAAQAPGPSPNPPAAPSGNGSSNNGSSDGNAAPPTAAAPGGATTTTSQSNTVYMPYGVPAPGTDLYPGLPSSSRPINGDQADSFDFGGSTGGPAVVYGNKGGSAVLSREGAATTPDIHVVRPGDTLWDLCARYYHSPWEWPRVWSYNPEITNPHWIYPGDQVRLRPANQIGLAPTTGNARTHTTSLGKNGNGLVSRRPSVQPNTIFLRDQGFLGDPQRDVWGELIGAVEEQMMLAEGNHVYVVLRPGVDAPIGQELTVFRTVRPPDDVEGARRPPGQIVAVSGTIRIDRWDPKTRIARGEIVESVDVIERGAKVGPVRRRFDVVPPRKDARDVEARVLTSIYPFEYYSQNQVVFLDRGSDDGLEPGNTLIVLRKGDTWRASLATGSKMVRDRVKIESPQRVEVETTPISGDESKFPNEAVAELRILRTEKYSSVAMVTQSRRELVPGDRAVAAVGR